MFSGVSSGPGAVLGAGRGGGCGRYVELAVQWREKVRDFGGRPAGSEPQLCHLLAFDLE